jgi:acyl-[acyl-carrier-protein]-phospholipid O-acyltransferase / long-chain-fatty-acid--[acyl-carrier-protein] ligase
MSNESQFSLLKTKRFLPLFIAQAIGAFNDNALRNAVIILITFDLAVHKGWNATLFVQAGTALFILPYFLFSAISGQLADKFDKSVMARNIKLAEIGAMIFGGIALWTDNPYFDLAVLFFAGTLSTFFAPIKYGIIPQYLKQEEVIGGNAMIEMGTFVTILLGTMFGGFLVINHTGREVLCAALVLFSLAAWYAASQMPAVAPASPDHKIDWNLFRQTGKLMGYARERHDVFWAIIGASWFWFLGTVLLTQFPVFTRDILLANENVANAFIATFTIGIGLGSMVTNVLLKGEVSAKYVPIAAVLMTVFLVDLYFSSGAVNARLAGTELNGVGVFFAHWTSWRVAFDLFFTAFCGGIYAVPLNAIMQTKASPPKRSRVIAANNVINAVFMIVATVLSAAFLQIMSARGLFLSLAIANLIAALWSIKLLPQEMMANFARQLFRLLFRVEVKGLEHYKAAGRKAVIVANHTSLIDGPLLSAFLPDRSTFAINSHMAKRWWVKPAFALFDLAPIDPTNPLAIRTLVDAVKKGSRVVIFPEGRITVTGALMKIYEGPGAIAQMADARVLPVRIDGAQYSKFSRMQGKLRLRWFPKITVTFLPPVKFNAPVELKGSNLREYQANKLYDVMSDMVFSTSNTDLTLFETLLDARAIHGGSHKIVEDIQRKPTNYNRLVMGSFILGRKIAKLTPNQKYVGVLLPNFIGGILTLFGLQAFGKVPAMLNFSTGAVNMSAACSAAQVRTIVTSRKFIEAGEMQGDIEILSKSCRIIYLEDVREDIGVLDKLFGLYGKFFPESALKSAGANKDPDAPAVVLFTSGSEGVPKGVVLSHRNLNANRLQAAARIGFSAQDIVFNAMPMFHAFGLLGGTLLPVLSGVYSFFYPSPLHYKIVPELCYDTNATVLFGTDTFLMGYARTANPYDFYSMRMIVAGAERVKEETRQVWMEKFGHRILEGYGTTECSPVLAINTPMHNKSGSVGRLLDRIETRLEPVEGIASGGRMHVRGPNIMLGYLRADNPGVIEPPPEGWYDTGDIVEIDEHNYVTILGRAKRFSKIAGEMVSLTAVETKLQAAFPGEKFAVVAIADPKKGEQLILFTSLKKPDRKAIADGLKAQGGTDLMAPKTLVHLAEMPLLGSGKTDYVTLSRLANDGAKG